MRPAALAAAGLLPLLLIPSPPAQAAASVPAGYVALDAYAHQVQAQIRYNPDLHQAFVVWSHHVWLAYPPAMANLPGETPANARLIGGRLFLPAAVLRAAMPPAPVPVAKRVALSSTSAAPTATLGRLEATLRSQLGAPYLWGGTSPAGFDCSGFVQWAFARIGVALPRTSFAQFGAGRAVSAPAPGDLVFFQTYASGASHVGVYLGQGRFIDVGQTVVRIASLAEPYWHQRYLGARAVLPGPG